MRKKFLLVMVGGGSNEPVDFDRYGKVTYLERLFDDILSEHGDHNKVPTLRKKCAERFFNISKIWVIIFCRTCPAFNVHRR